LSSEADADTRRLPASPNVDQDGVERVGFLSQQRIDWVAAGLLLVAVLVLFVPALLHPDHMLYPTFASHSDLTVAHWPKAYLIAQTWQAERSLPSWTPANLSGMPLAANPVAMRFYPLSWLFLFLPINAVFNLLFVFHLFWGGLGVYRLSRADFGLDPIPALAGGLTFALGGKLLAHAAGGHVILVAAVAWMSWALLGTHRLLRRGHLRWAGLAAVALAMQVVTDVRILLYTAYLLLAYVLWELLVVERSYRKVPVRSTVPRLMLIPIMAGVLGAAQLFPLIELAGYSNRTLSLTEAGQFALTPLTLLLGLFLPDARGGHELVVYLGLVSLILAVLGLRGSDRRSWFFGGVVLLAVLFALGSATPLFELVYRWVPGFHWVRSPTRVFLLASLGVAILTGMGMQHVAQGHVRWLTLLALAVGMLTLGLGLGLAVVFGQVNRATLGLACLPSLTLLVIGLATRRCIAPSLALISLTLLLLTDLTSFDLTLMRFVAPAEAFADGRAVTGYLAKQPGLFRTYSPSYSLPSHVAAQAGVQTADGVEGVHLAIYDRFMALAGGYGDSSFSVTIPPFPPDRPLTEAFRNIQPDLQLLGLLNVEYLVTAFPMDWPGLTLVTEVGETYVYRNQYALPRAWIVNAGLDSGVGWRGQLAALAEQSTQAVAAAQYPAEVTYYAPDRIRIEARSPENGMLVLSEMWYPGWRATVDGDDEPVRAVAGILRGVTLTEGTHQIEFIYDPASVRWGERLSLAGVISMFGWGVAMLWRRKQPKFTEAA
jgi:hypothetical protein